MGELFKLKKQLSAERKSNLERKKILTKQQKNAMLESVKWKRTQIRNDKLISRLIERRKFWLKQTKEVRGKVNHALINLMGNQHALNLKLQNQRGDRRKVLKFVRVEMRKLRRQINLLVKQTQKLSVVTKSLGKERTFERHTLARLTNHRNRLESKMEKMSGILRNMQRKVARKKKRKN